jgi:hypothetical protein
VSIPDTKWRYSDELGITESCPYSDEMRFPILWSVSGHHMSRQVSTFIETFGVRHGSSGGDRLRRRQLGQISTCIPRGQCPPSPALRPLFQFFSLTALMGGSYARGRRHLLGADFCLRGIQSVRCEMRSLDQSGRAVASCNPRA